MSGINRLKILLFGKDEKFLSDLVSEHGALFDIQRALSPSMVDFLTKEWEPRICVLQANENIESLVCFLRTKMPYNDMGIIVVTESSEVAQQKEKSCFRSGADHFVHLGESIDPVVHRIEALEKKISWSREEPADFVVESTAAKFTNLQYGPISIFPNDFIVKVMGETISPTPTQFRLLLTFISHKDQLLTRSWLKSSVWGDSEISPRTIDAQISKLKKIIPYLEEHIVNVYGKGYILTEPRQNVA